jgi:hypothetical protein
MHVGQKVQVYWNSHRKEYSIRDKETRRVVGHAELVHLHDVTLKVSEAGRQRVLKYGVKNMHAWAEGTLHNASGLTDEIDLSDIFYLYGEPLYYSPHSVKEFRNIITDVPYRGCSELAMSRSTTLLKDGVWRRIPILSALAPYQ